MAKAALSKKKDGTNSTYKTPQPSDTAGGYAPASKETVQFVSCAEWRSILPQALTSFQTQVLILLAIVLAVFGNTVLNQNALDDMMVITGNKYVQKGIAGIPDILTKDTSRGFYGDLHSALLIYYRPLSVVTFAIEKDLWDNNPFMGHLINVLLYGLSVVVIFTLLRKYLLRALPDVAFFAALLFAVHPLHTEVVANIKGRDDILNFLFMGLTFLYFFKWLDDPTKSTKNLFYSLGAYVFAFLSKENALLLVGMLPLMLYFFTDAKLNKIISLTLPFLGIAIFYLIFRKAMPNIGLKGSISYPDILFNRYYQKTFSEKYGTVIYVLLLYLKLLVFPHPLTCDYSYRHIPYYDLVDPWVWASLAINGALVYWAIKNLRQKHILSFAILFYYVSIALVSNLVIDIGGFVAERFLFQGVLSIGIAVSFGLIALVRRMQDMNSQRYIVLGVMAILIVALGAKSIARNTVWMDNETLFITDAATCPNSAMLNKGAGGSILNKANIAKDTTEKMKLYHESTKYLKKSLAIHPTFIDANIDLASAYANMRFNDTTLLDSAGKYALIANRIDASYPLLKPVKENLAIAFLARAQRAYAAGNLDLELSSLLYCVEFEPNRVDAVYNVGRIYFQKKQYAQCEPWFKKATDLMPNNPNYWADLASCYLYQNKIAEGRFAVERALQLDPKHPHALSLMAGFQPVR